MAGLPVEIRGTLYDLANKRQLEVYLVGDAVRGDVSVGGGPIYPPEGGGDGKPPGIWGPPGPWPTPPIHLPPEGGGKPPGNGSPPGIWGPPGPWPTPPIYYPPQVPPEAQPPQTPPPGTVTPVPPPAGAGGWPVAPVVPPEYLVIQYPGIGPVYVTPPPHAEPAR